MIDQCPLNTSQIVGHTSYIINKIFKKKSINFPKSRILTNDALHLALSIYIILVHNKVLLNTLHVNFRVLHSFENIHNELRTKKNIALD